MFNPEEFGFKIVGSSGGDRGKNFCYLRISHRTEGDRREANVRLVLDEETTDCALELFGDRVNVAVDESGRVVLYKGKSRKLARVSKSKGKRVISLCSECDFLLSLFGMDTVTEYTAKIWAKGEAILLTPKDSMEGKE